MNARNTMTLIVRLLVVAAIVALLGAGWWAMSRPKPIAVVFKSVDQGKVESTVANTRAGTVEACQRTKLAPIMGGRIEKLAVKEGDHVQKGQMLMQLWNEDQLAQSNLALTQVEVARQRTTEVCTLAANAEREAQRLTALREQNYISNSREEAAVAEAKARRASCNVAKADVSQAEARVFATRVEQTRTRLIAPFAGTVAKIVGEVGEYSTPSPPGVPTPPAIDLIDETCLYIKAPMDEVDAPKITPGLPVRISLDALPRQSFAGRVKRVAPYITALEKQSRTVDIEAVFDSAADSNANPQGKLLVGYSADVEVVLAVRENVIRVPTTALQEGNQVLIEGADGVLEARKIKTGIANWEYTEVLEGLKPGERVVTSLEREGVKAGAHVVADPASSPVSSPAKAPAAAKPSAAPAAAAPTK